MNTELVLMLIGEDRPGLVERVSQVLVNRQGRWLESQFSRLEGKFAGILRTSVPVAQESALKSDLRALADQGLQVMIEEGRQTDKSPLYPLSLQFVGLDRCGIVSEISEILSRYGVTILNLSSRCIPAPMSGEGLFYAEFEVRVPVSVDSEHLGEALETLTPELMVDFQPAELMAV